MWNWVSTEIVPLHMLLHLSAFHFWFWWLLLVCEFLFYLVIFMKLNFWRKTNCQKGGNWQGNCRDWWMELMMLERCGIHFPTTGDWLPLVLKNDRWNDRQEATEMAEGQERYTEIVRKAETVTCTLTWWENRTAEAVLKDLQKVHWLK